MAFDLPDATVVLSRTPGVLVVMLKDIPDSLSSATEGPDTWSPFDIVGHLIHGERTDWIPRAEHILAHGDAVPFPPFDRFAQFEASRGRTLGELLDTFTELRADSMHRLEKLGLTAADLTRTGLHPALGRVTLGQHLSTWVVHDLDHIAQIARVMGRQYAEVVGPWRQYLRIVGTV